VHGFIAGALPEILLVGATYNQVSTSEYLMPFVFKASSIKGAFS